MKFLTLLSSITLCTTLLTACGSDKVEEKVAVKEVEEKVPIFDTTYSVAVIDTIEPYTFRNDNDELTGFHIDLINAISKVEKFNVNYISKEWDAEWTYIQNDEYNFLLPAITITPERKKLVDFSAPVLDAKIDLVVGDALKDKSFDEIITDPKNTFGTLEASAFIKYAQSLGIEKKNIVEYKSMFLSIEKVLSSTVTVAIGDSNLFKYNQRLYPEINIVSNSKNTGQLAYIMKKGNIEVKNKLNTGLKKIKENGEFDTIYKKWFEVESKNKLTS